MKTKQQIVRLPLALVGLVLSAATVSAQDYTYQWEGFEDAAWGTAGASVTSATGKWTTNKNVQSTEQVFEGSYSLKVSAKAGFVTPQLPEGAGALVYYANVTNRQVTVSTSEDGTNWTPVESYKETSDWTKHTVAINDKKVRYVKVSTNSNNQLFIDNFVITKADGSLADGTTLVPAIDVPYFTQTFEANNACPSAKEDVATPKSWTIDGQGEWVFYNAYKGTNESYIVDGSARDLRMLKNGSYVISPVLDQGVARIQFAEGRKGKAFGIYASSDGGTTWKLLRSLSTETNNTIEIYDRSLNRIKIVNESSDDADIDNLCITAFPEGTLPAITTGDAIEVSSSKALIAGTLTAKGDKRMLEWGICWNTESDDCTLLNAQRVTASADAFNAQLTGLPCETRITYRAYAMSMAGVAYGEVKSFTTQAPTAPVIAVDPLKIDESMGDEKHIFVRLSASIEDNGGAAPTEVGVCYNTTGNPTTADASLSTYVYGNKFSQSIPLEPQTTYYLRAYSINRAGTGYSKELTITTPELILPEYAHNVYYVSPTGNDATGDGSEANPFYNVQLAVDKVVAGDTIYVMAGTYNYSARINASAVGQRNSGMIALFAKGGRAILDFKTMGLGDNNQGMRLTGSFWHIYGIDICNAGDNGLLIERNKPSGGTYNDIKDKTDEGHDNLIENCKFYRNMDTGLQMKNLAENNKIINCDSYFNSDPDHEDSDGFAVKVSHGTGNYFYGCRAWSNCDDGWDGFVKTDGGFPDDCTTTYENCWAFHNGYVEEGTTTGNGDGNGFKLGSAYGAHNAILNRCLSFENYQKGFDQNHNSGSMIFNNCTGFAMPLLSNKSHYTYRIDEPVSNGHEVRFTNCVAISDGISDRTKSAYAPYSIAGNKVTITTCDFNTLPADYQSVDYKGMDGDRDAHGNLPVLPFMRIAEGNSKLIDKGTPVVPYPGQSIASVGVDFNGAAPDLGCFETEGPATGIESLPMADPDASDSFMMQVKCSVDGLWIVSLQGNEDLALRTLYVTDVAGHLLATHTFYGQTTVVNMSDYKGLALVTVKAGTKVQTLKIIK